MSLQAEQLDDATKKRLGLDRLPPELGEIGSDLVYLGRILKVVQELDDDDALEMLRKAQLYLVSRKVAPEITALDVAFEKPALVYIPDVRWVVDVVAQASAVDAEEIMGRIRTGDVAEARKVAMYILVMTNKYSMTAIGRAIGARSPPTVSAAFASIATKCSVDAGYKEHVAGLQTMVGVNGHRETP